MFNNNFSLKSIELRRTMKATCLPLILQYKTTKSPLSMFIDLNSDKPSFYEVVRYIFLDLYNEYFILCNDVNLVVNPIV